MPVDREQFLQASIARLRRRSNQLESLSRKYWFARRFIFIVGAVLALIAWQFAGGTVAVLSVFVFATIFTVVAIYHNRVRESIRRSELMTQIKDVQIARIKLDWDHLPPADQLPEPNHPFALDIDLTGERSLHRLLDSAVTSEGSLRLQNWLLDNNPDSTLITERQSLVRELKNLSLFRDKLQLCAAIVSSEGVPSHLNKPRTLQLKRWEPHHLIAWLENPVTGKELRPIVILLAINALSNLVLFALGSFGLIPAIWPITFLIYVGLMIAKQSSITSAWGDVQDLEKALRRFGVVFKYLETRGCAKLPALAQVCAPFLDSRKRPSVELRRIERMAAALGLRTNAILWLLINALVPWDFFFTYRLEQLKKEIGHLLPHWLDTWYQLEALNSLGNFAWLNPTYTFPEIADRSSLFAAQQLGHPLIKPAQKICNDFELDADQRIIILTGSNMAGKSTFLRSVGLNLCLAYAGAPVNARSLKLSLFRLFTCIKVSDSVQDGLSYFYAEVKRLKLLLSAVELSSNGSNPPILFLIDEIFRGTNNRERHIGSEAFIRALSSQGDALGLIATHDLELTRLADSIPGIANFHFREEIGDGRMVFDYLLRRGPCPTTNALKIMRIEGLPVDV